jgi:hypothetical protein
VSSPRGRRRAALPSAGFRRPSAIDDSGLVFTLFGENGGVEGVYSFADLPGSIALRQAIVRGFAEVCGPGRVWTSSHSAENARGALRSLLTFACSRPDPPQMAEHLTPALLAAWNDDLGPAVLARKNAGLARKVLLAAPGVPAGAGRALRLRADGAKELAEPESYSLEEFERIRACAASLFNTALTRIRGNREHLRRWYAGAFEADTDEYLRGQALDGILRTGDVPRYVAAGSQESGRVRAAYLRALGGAKIGRCRNELYLDTVELFALHVLLVAAEGWNRSVLARMTVPDHDPAAADEFDIHMVKIDKRRRPVRLRHTSNNLVDDGPDSPGRLMARAIEATELARQTLTLLGQPTDLLLVGRAGVWQRTPRGGFLFGVTKGGTKIFADRVGLTDAEGNRRAVTLRPLRRTVQVRIRKEPSHNSPETHDDVYVLRDATTPQATADTIAEGLNNALEHARTVTTMKMLLGDDAEVLLELADHPQLAQAVTSGAADTATAACMGFTDSPHAEPGQPCPASFLLCLGCRNAIATPRHLPRLVYLHSCLDSLRGTVGEQVWELDWREHWLRLESLLNVHTTVAQRADALRRSTERDRTLIDDLLRRRLDP